LNFSFGFLGVAVYVSVLLLIVVFGHVGESESGKSRKGEERRGQMKYNR
jgi:hypothetical protein